MKTGYLPSFLKDLKGLAGSPVFAKVKKLAFEDVPKARDLAGIPHVKRLRGPGNSYRVRIGDHRVGFFLQGDTVVFARALHRKDIYRFFPPN